MFENAFPLAKNLVLDNWYVLGEPSNLIAMRMFMNEEPLTFALMLNGLSVINNLLTDRRMEIVDNKTTEFVIDNYLTGFVVDCLNFFSICKLYKASFTLASFP